jgi:osmotically-inducible protein OsmY
MFTKKIILVSAAIFSLTGCLGLAVTGATTTGYTAAQERTIGHAVDDWGIWAQIKHMYLQKNVSELLGKIRVEVIEGRVLLAGTVSNPADRIEAVRIAWQPTGVKEVLNNIEVSPPGYKPSISMLKDIAKDNVITSSIKGKLLIEKDIRSVNYSVETNNGVVYLMGIAQSDVELERVTQISSHIKGVRKVVSYVVLKDDQRRN